MRVFVINVGVNTALASAHRIRSPIFPDGTFEFLPIPEFRSGHPDIPAYCDLRACTANAEKLDAFVPEMMKHCKVHNDPNFSSMVYGDVMTARSSNLAKCSEGDHIWFLARLWNHDGKRWLKGSDFYFVARVVVEANLLIENEQALAALEPPTLRRIADHAHILRAKADPTSLPCRLILGDQDGSVRFKYGVKVTAEVAGHFYGGRFDPQRQVYVHNGEALKNKNGKPRRFERFGSVTRAIQSYLDSDCAEHICHIESLNRLADIARGK